MDREIGGERMAELYDYNLAPLMSRPYVLAVNAMNSLPSRALRRDAH